MKAIDEALRQKDRILDRPLKSLAPKDQFCMTNFVMIEEYLRLITEVEANPLPLFFLDVLLKFCPAIIMMYHKVHFII